MKQLYIPALSHDTPGKVWCALCGEIVVDQTIDRALHARQHRIGLLRFMRTGAEGYRLVQSPVTPIRHID